MSILSRFRRKAPVLPTGPSDLEILSEFGRRRAAHPNPLCRYGQLGFAQSDEDGITLEILRRLGIARGTFLELGVGDGSENNTLVLLAKGWTGAWVGGETLCFPPSSSPRLRFTRAWITRENVWELAGRPGETSPGPDVLSIDLDGNDLHILDELLVRGVRPELVIAEYNARFPAGVEFCVEYAAERTWAGDDHFGASLHSFCLLLGRHGYRLVCCNAATGANAFFVREEHADRFPEVPAEEALIHAEPFYHLPARKGHPASLKTLLRMIA